MDEFAAALRARELVNKINSNDIPVNVEKYISSVPGCELRVKRDLPDEQPGYSFSKGGKHFIVVNGKDPSERQRFTALHELAHIDLGLPSEHTGLPGAKRSPNEICCDVYAAELLLPYRIFKPLVLDGSVGVDIIDELAGRFDASFTATGSRFAALTNVLCAFVISDNGKVRYASRSNSLRDAGAWIPPGMDLPASSLSARRRSGDSSRSTNQMAADLWFSDWRRGGKLLEEALHIKRLDQTLTLLWFDEDEVSDDEKPVLEDDDDRGLLDELDGVLTFAKPRRKK